MPAPDDPLPQGATRPTSPPVEPATTRWFFARNKQKTGPFPWERLRQMATAGQLAPSDLVLAEGQSEWQPAGDLNGLFAPVALACTLDTRNDPNRIQPERPVPASSALPLTIGNYSIEAELGRGGMGVVYRARQAGLDRTVALKMILHADYAGAEERQRFAREAQIIASMQHPNIVQVHEVGKHEGKPFFSLEYVDGGSLDRHLSGKPLPPRDAAALVEKLALAMHAAHDRGIIHRDLKPANVLLARSDPLQRVDDGPAKAGHYQPKITDFGLAKNVAAAGQTPSGAIMGTPSYMAPEQAGGKTREIDARADVYALGAILYECLTGRAPFVAATPLETLLQVVRVEPVRPAHLNPAVPRDMETICLKCLQKDAGNRYQTARDLAEDVGRFLRGEPIMARPVGRVERAWRWCRRNPVLAAAAAAALLAACAAGFFAWQAWDAEKQRLADKRKRDEELRVERQAVALDKAVAAALNGQDDEAIRQIAAAEELGAPREELSKVRGIIALYQGDPKAALAHLTIAADGPSPSLAVKALLARTYFDLGDARDEPQITELGPLEPLTPEDFLFKGQIICQYDDPRVGLRDIEQALHRRPTPLARLALADARVQLALDTGSQADAEDAVRDAELARQLLPTSDLTLTAALEASCACRVNLSTSNF